MNGINLLNGVNFIPLGGKHGVEKYAMIDAEDFEKINQYRWRAQKIGNVFYATTSIQKEGKRNFLYMHRLIFDNKFFRIDHENQNGLNNCRYNLRPCTGSQNGINRGKNKNNTSGYKGVTYVKGRKKPWLAQIKFDRENVFIGYFATAIEAAIAYDEKAKELFGEFAKINF